MSLSACEYCGGFDQVRWDLSDGDVCQPCYEKRRAWERQKQLDDEREAEMLDRQKWQFWHD